MHIAKWFILAGTVLIIAGIIMILLQKFGVQLGKLPGDIVWRGSNVTIYIPLMTGLLLSILLTLLFRLFK